MSGNQEEAKKYRGTCVRSAVALVGPYYHPVKMKASPESSCLLTMLTMLSAMASATTRRTTARPQTERTGAVEDASVQSQVEGGTRVDWFGNGCVLGLTSQENNMTCGGIEGGTGQHWRVRTVGRRRRSQPWEAGAGGADGVVWFGRLEEDKR